MQYIIEDKRYSFKSAFDTQTGAYVRTGVLDENGADTGVDPFMASYPHGSSDVADNGTLHTRKDRSVCEGRDRMLSARDACGKSPIWLRYRFPQDR